MQERLLHLALGRQSKCHHLKSTGSIAAHLHSEQDHRLWLLVSNSKIQRQKSIWRQVSGSDTAVLLAGHTALAVVVLKWTVVRGQGWGPREVHKGSQGWATPVSAQPSPLLPGKTMSMLHPHPCSPLFFHIHGWLTVVGDTPKIYVSMLAPRSMVTCTIAKN